MSQHIDTKPLPILASKQPLKRQKSWLKVSKQSENGVWRCFAVFCYCLTWKHRLCIESKSERHSPWCQFIFDESFLFRSVDAQNFAERWMMMPRNCFFHFLCLILLLLFAHEPGKFWICFSLPVFVYFSVGSSSSCVVELLLLSFFCVDDCISLIKRQQ